MSLTSYQAAPPRAPIDARTIRALQLVRKLIHQVSQRRHCAGADRAFLGFANLQRCHSGTAIHYCRSPPLSDAVQHVTNFTGVTVGFIIMNRAHGVALLGDLHRGGPPAKIEIQRRPLAMNCVGHVEALRQKPGSLGVDCGPHGKYIE